MHELQQGRAASGELVTTDELLKLLRFQRLDARNGAISGEPDAIRLCGAAADEIARLQNITGHALLLLKTGHVPQAIGVLSLGDDVSGANSTKER